MFSSVMEERRKLSQELRKFVQDYAITAAEKDLDGEEKYNSPDAYAVLATADQLQNENTLDADIIYPDSSYFQGGYKNSAEGEKLHQKLLEQVAEIRDAKRPCKHCKEHVNQYRFCTNCGKPLFE